MFIKQFIYEYTDPMIFNVIYNFIVAHLRCIYILPIEMNRLPVYGVSHEGKYCTKFLNQYSFICSKFYKLYKYNINISHNKTTGLRKGFNNLNVNNI